MVFWCIVTQYNKKGVHSSFPTQRIKSFSLALFWQAFCFLSDSYPHIEIHWCMGLFPGSRLNPFGIPKWAPAHPPHHLCHTVAVFCWLWHIFSKSLVLCENCACKHVQSDRDEWYSETKANEICKGATMLYVRTVVSKWNMQYIWNKEHDA